MMPPYNTPVCQRQRNAMAASAELLHLAAHGTLTPAIIAGMVRDGASVNSCGSDGAGWPVLMWAVTKGQTAIVEALVDAGANPNIRDRHGRTALHMCAIGGNVQIQAALMRAGAELNAAAADGQTPLVALVVNGLGDVEERLALMLSRADLDLDKPCTGMSAQRFARSVQRPALADAIAAEVWQQ